MTAPREEQLLTTSAIDAGYLSSELGGQIARVTAEMRGSALPVPGTWAQRACPGSIRAGGAEGVVVQRLSPELRR